MQVKRIGPNALEVEDRDGVTVLFSYSKPVAIIDTKTNKAMRTSEFFSQTTSRHINAWLQGRPSVVVGQDVIERLSREGK